MDLNLKKKRAFVCGSTQGIGKAIALELANLGASITLIARNEESLKEVQAALFAASGQKHGYIVADFSNSDQLKYRLDEYLKSGVTCEILINNTGGPPGGQAIDAALDEFTSAFSNHLLCNQILTQALVPLMRKANYGRIINIISTSVKIPLRGLGVSNTIRGAVANWAKTLSLELAGDGITVNNVLPGATNTARLSSIIENKAAKGNLAQEQVEKAMLSQIPAGRFGLAEEVAAAAAFLASPAAGYINGVNLPVDGGRTGCL